MGFGVKPQACRWSPPKPFLKKRLKRFASKTFWIPKNFTKKKKQLISEKFLKVPRKLFSKSFLGCAPTKTQRKFFMKHITLKRSILTALSLLLIFSVIFVSCKAKGKVELPESPDTIKASNIYTLSFTVGGQIYFSETHEAGDKISYPQDPTVAGYDFISWDAEV